jgi:hypothetical protein
METVERIQTVPVRSHRKMVDPAGWFADRSYAAKVWFYLFLLAIALNVAQGPFWYAILHQTEFVTTIDESGTFHRSPLLGYDTSVNLYRYHAELAVTALFNRNPHGVDFPDLVPQIFRPKAYKRIESYLKIDAQDFADKKLFQKASISDYRIVDQTESGGTVIVLGQLIKQGEVNGERYLPDPDDFTLLLVFKRNPDMTKNGRLPLAVESWQLKINNVLVSLDEPLSTATPHP